MNYLKINILIFFLLPLSLLAGEKSLDQRIKEGVNHYFYKLYQVTPQKMHISYLRFPDLSTLNNIDCDIYISSQKSKARLGYQTLWTELTVKGKRIKRFPISLDIGLEADVLVASKRIKRHQTIRPELLKWETRIIKSDWDNVFKAAESVSGKESTRVIQKGTIIKLNLVRSTPLIHRGDRVKVEVEAGQMILSSAAIAKNDAGMGEIVPVESIPGGKRIMAKVKGPGVVYFAQERAL